MECIARCILCPMQILLYTLVIFAEMAQKAKRCVAEHDEECAQFAKYLVPKCCIHAPYTFCTERKSCGIAPRLSDVYKAYLNWVSEHE